METNYTCACDQCCCTNKVAVKGGLCRECD
jgi:hypothetical protein